MKKLSLLISLIITIIFTSCISYETARFEKPYGKRINGLNHSKEELYVEANKWMIKNFNHAESVIQFRDKEAGSIIGKYLLKSGSETATTSNIFALIDIRVRDGYAFISIEPYPWQYDANKTGTIYTYSKEDAQEDMEKLAESLEKHLQGQTMSVFLNER